jgi:nitrogen fixation protein
MRFNDEQGQTTLDLANGWQLQLEVGLASLAIPVTVEAHRL